MKKHQIYCLLLVVLILFTLFISGVPIGFFLTSSSHSHIKYQDEKLSVGLAEEANVVLNETGYDPAKTKSLTVAATFDDRHSSTRVKFFTGFCSKLKRNFTELPIVPRLIQPLDDSRMAYNYHYGHIPIYNAGGVHTQLTYSINITNTKLTDSCVMELFLFDSEANYMAYLNDDSSFPQPVRYLNRSGCISSTPNNTVVTFPIETPGLYFVAAFIKKDFYTYATIYGHVSHFVVNSDFNLVTSCALSAQRNICQLMSDINYQNAGRSHYELEADNRVCVLALSNDYILLNVTVTREVSIITPENKPQRIGSIAGLGVLAGIELLLICCCLCCCCCVFGNSRSNYENQYDRLENVDDDEQPSVQSTEPPTHNTEPSTHATDESGNSINQLDSSMPPQPALPINISKDSTSEQSAMYQSPSYPDSGQSGKLIHGMVQAGIREDYNLN